MHPRQRKIVQMVGEHGRLSVGALAQAVGVSLVTIRHDLQALHQRGELFRVHGGAVALQSHALRAGLQRRYAAKQGIAGYAASLVRDGDTLYLDGCSISLALIDALYARRGLTIVTTHPDIAERLKQSEHQAMIVGGLRQTRNDARIGAFTCSCLSQLRFQRAFLGIGGWHWQSGFTEPDPLSCAVKNVVAAHSDEVVLLADSSRFGRTHPHALAPADAAVTRVITDTRLSPKYRQYFARRAIRLNVINAPEAVSGD
ncbi:Glycerol-3-phosphate regulon repressor [Serratia rubidaea]|nr:Glycerol-3-phosphate regulon repressor [Serratia rubidaea]